MKIFKRIVIVLEILCLIGIAIFLIMFCFPKKRGVDYMLSVFELNIPKYETVYKKEKWQDYYEYKILFPKSDSVLVRKQAEKFKKINEYYENKYDGKSFDIMYSSMEDGDYHYWACITPNEGTAVLRMSFEWGEQLMCFLYAYLLFWLGLAIGAIYVITFLVVKYLIR